MPKLLMDGGKPDDRAWDGSAAKGRIAKWASSDGSGDKDKVSWSKYGQGFAVVDTDAEDFGSFHLPYCDVVDDELMAIKSGVQAAGNAVQGSRGARLSDAAKAKAKSALGSFYAKWDAKPPWEADKAGETIIEHDLREGLELKVAPEGVQRVLSALNNALVLEYSAIKQYMAQSVMVKAATGIALAGQIEDVAKEEMGHADQLLNRIDFLGGIPATMDAAITIGPTDVESVAGLDMKAETAAQNAYTALIAVAAEWNDITTKEMAKEILGEEEAHAYFFQQISDTPTGPADAPAGTGLKGKTRMPQLKRGGERGHINVPFEVKSVSEGTDPDTGEPIGIFEGYAACYSKDLGNDVILPGAFKRTLNASGGEIAILWFHDPKLPCGLGMEATEDANGLYVKGKLNLDTQVGHDTYSNMKFGIVDCMSIGYEVPKGKSERKDGVRYLSELLVPEYSLLTKGFSMNEDALVGSVKSTKDFNSELATAQAQQASWESRWQIDDALRSVLNDLLGDDDNDELSNMTDDEKIGVFRASLAQYTEAMCSWLRGALALDAQEDASETTVMAMSRELEDLAVKVGRRNSASDASKIKQAIGLLTEVLDNEEAPAGDDSTDKSLVKCSPPDLAAQIRSGLVRLGAM